MDPNACPRCRTDERTTNPTVIAADSEWQFCTIHMLRWRIGAATEPLPAGANSDAFMTEFLEVY